jgi:hypothetical protein
MKEAEWLMYSDPQPMLDFLQGTGTDRKRWLFAAACYRGAPHLLEDEHIRQGLEVLERRADGQATGKEIRDVSRACREAYFELEATAGDEGSQVRAFASLILYRLLIASSGRYAAQDASHAARLIIHANLMSEPVQAIIRTRSEGHCRLLREVFGDPFQRLAFASVWRSPQALALARAVYEDRSWHELPLLADALEEAGCTEETVLSHLRGPGPHVRGCWPVDLILDRA